MGLLQGLQIIFVLLYSDLKLLNVLCASFSKGCLRLPVSLLALLGRGINLRRGGSQQPSQGEV